MFSKSSKAANGKSGHGVPQKPATPSIISTDLRIVGDLHSDGEIQIDGTVDGDIRTKILLVGETAMVKGETVADTVSVHGTVNGQIKANTVSLSKTARVTGDILHQDLAIEKGAFLEGHCKRLEDKNKKAADNRINLLVRESAAADEGAAPAKKAAPS